jgi:hypothetical protein
LDRISKSLYRISNLPIMLICLVVFLVFGVTQLPAQSARAAVYSGSSGTPDTSLFYSTADLYRMAESYGAEGRQAYIQARFTFDLAFPLVYGAFLATALGYLLGHALNEGSPWRRLNLLPLAGMLFDYLENIFAARVMAAYPTPQPTAAALAALFTPLKWLFISASFLLLPFALIIFFRKTNR